MPIPPGRYTRQQIRNLALNRAGNRALDTDAQSWLAQLLFDLDTLYDWPWLHVTTTVTIASDEFALPDDFYQSQDDAALNPISLNGQTLSGGQPLLEVDPGTFELRRDPNAYGQPLVWMVDRALNIGRVTPNPVGLSLVARLRYKRITAEPAAADEATDIPVFPWSDYLVQRVYLEALKHERDPRVMEATAEAEAMFARIRRATEPRGAASPIVPLDPTFFRTPFQGD